MDAKDSPVKRQYSRKEVNTGEMEVGQRADVDLGELVTLLRGGSLADNVGEKPLTPEYAAELAFMEEPVTIRIEENSRSDFPETHVPCYVNGTPAEVYDEKSKKWMPFGWLPVNVPMIIKRKYIEVLARSKPDSIRTNHQEATVERPQNTVTRKTTSQYPMSIIHDANPKGHEWLSRIMMGY